MPPYAAARVTERCHRRWAGVAGLDGTGDLNGDLVLVTALGLHASAAHAGLAALNPLDSSSLLELHRARRDARRDGGRHADRRYTLTEEDNPRW
jgi:hypothetical protein